MEIINLLKGIADETRIRILNILNTGEYCVCDIESILNLTQSNASRHLNKLKSLKLINSEKKAQWVYYSLNKKTILEYSFINKLMNENLTEEVLIKDLEKINIYLKNNNRC